MEDPQKDRDGGSIGVPCGSIDEGHATIIRRPDMEASNCGGSKVATGGLVGKSQPRRKRRQKKDNGAVGASLGDRLQRQPYLVCRRWNGRLDSTERASCSSHSNDGKDRLVHEFRNSMDG